MKKKDLTITLEIDEEPIPNDQIINIYSDLLNKIKSEDQES